MQDTEEEAFFVLEGDLVFTLGYDEIEATPGTYVYIPPGTRHPFRCRSEVGSVFNTLSPGGLDHGIRENATPATIVEMPPPGVFAEEVWRTLAAERPASPWDGLAEWPQVRM